MKQKPNKRLIFCFDGTFNKLAVDEPTNVARMAQMVRPVARDGVPQVVYYDEGIGTGVGGLRKLAQGAFGWGMLPILRDAYRFLIFNYEPGDHIYAFGFSRGAFTARSFLGFIRHAGILDVVSASRIDKALEIYRKAPAGKTGLESGEALRFRAKYCANICVSEVDREFRSRIRKDVDWAGVPLLDIRYLGVWDTVGALGWPETLPLSGWFNRKYRFHDAILTSKIGAARHAVALDEELQFFPVTLFGREKTRQLNSLFEQKKGEAVPDWQRPYMEKWFPGIHGSVGGGGARKGLPDAALFWVLTGARRAGLDVRTDLGARTFDIEPNGLGYLLNTPPKTGILASIVQTVVADVKLPFLDPRSGPETIDDLSLAACQRMVATRDGLMDEDRKVPVEPGLVPWLVRMYRKWRAARDGGQASGSRAYIPRALKHRPDFIDQWQYADRVETKSGYVIEKGKTLLDVAELTLGDRSRYMEIFDANRDQLDDPHYYPAGIVVRSAAD
ncbi:peptigoglycan-binding protein LysM [Altererythrobacter sp. RZ02]|uniref:Peptigoglycan-binding protein LysM n=1 Tax=Pontixanthobacter rizhaonensis TaxID=2730337 RepID=A0A848QN80_9SPHN|nr:DUF2235 domain-containing protein [Pontixanthobacter rizhaonensis]NMW32200.1 peptigoglycan-binding protein LysM [Pontixanthobacter rizhaonensis]